MADLQVKTANICNVTSSTLLNSNAGGSGTYISDNNISVYMSGTATWSGTYCQYTNDYAVVDDYYTISFTPICATNSTLQIEVAGTAKKITFTSGTRTSVTIQATSTSRYVAFYGGDTVEKTVIIKDIQIEKGETATPYRPYSATGWVHSLRKLTTATEAVENPLYSDGTAITSYTIKGNTVQSGTPTPSNPVDVNGVGERTENLAHDISVNTVTAQYSSVLYFDADLKPDTTYVVHVETENEYQFYSNEKLFTTSTYKMTTDGHADWVLTTQSTLDKSNPQQAYNGRWNILKNGRTQSTDVAMTNIMITEGSTIPTSYIPYGYKIPISTLQGSAVNYLGSVQSTRQIKKYIFDGTEYWNNAVASDIFGVGNLFGTAPFIPEVTALCTEYTYNSRQGGYASGLTSGEFALQKYTSGGNESYTPYFRNSSYTTVDQWKAYLQQQYAAGTPVTVWYVLATAETAAVNEPLMKIGTYADSISNATSIPTTEGANSITVDTTVQPSEFTATWTGWHDASVKEKSENLMPSISLDNGWKQGYRNGTNGSYNPNHPNGEWLSPFIDIGDITSLVVSAKPIGNKSMNIYYFNGDTYIRTEGGNNYDGTVFTNFPTGTTKICVALRTGCNSEAEIIQNGYWFMLNAGSTALPYEPYWK